MNYFKTAMLLAVLTALLVFFGDALGGRQGAVTALVFAGFINFISFWFSDKIVLRMYGEKGRGGRAHALRHRKGPHHEGRHAHAQGLYDENDALTPCHRRNRTTRQCVTTGIMKLLTKEELSGVIGHELSHIRNRDILIATIAATIAGAISYLSHMAYWFSFASSSRDDDRGGNPVALIVMAVVAPIAAMIIQLAISRSREYVADAGGAGIAGNPLYLANALRKLEYFNKRIPMQRLNQATSHMFIVSPFSGSSMLKLFSTHPPMEERIKRLEAMVGLGR